MRKHYRKIEVYVPQIIAIFLTQAVGVQDIDCTHRNMLIRETYYRRNRLCALSVCVSFVHASFAKDEVLLKHVF